VITEPLEGAWPKPCKCRGGEAHRAVQAAHSLCLAGAGLRRRAASSMLRALSAVLGCATAVEEYQKCCVQGGVKRGGVELVQNWGAGAP